MIILSFHDFGANVENLFRLNNKLTFSALF